VQRSPLPHLQQGQYTHDLLGTVPLKAWANMSELVVPVCRYIPMLAVCLGPRVHVLRTQRPKAKYYYFPRLVSHWPM
jgi:hypothetical protein